MALREDEYLVDTSHQEAMVIHFKLTEDVMNKLRGSPSINVELVKTANGDMVSSYNLFFISIRLLTVIYNCFNSNLWLRSESH